MGRFRFDEVAIARGKRIEENRECFETLLGNVIAAHHEQTKSISTEQTDQVEGQGDRAVLVVPTDNEATDEKRSVVTIENQAISLPEELNELVDQIRLDLGELPQGYVSAAFGLSGRGRAPDQGGTDQAVAVETEFFPYDEWDYRRQGYRRNWCSLRERELSGVRTDFVSSTLKKYRGSLTAIRRKFEMLRTQERFARRRRYGDDIDLDALVDSLGDQYAGLAPSEKVFVRLMKSSRSISTLFLVDMSNSTEGWVGIAIKEALILLCEAMDQVGDPYGIYGFSGMRRMRSEVYRIKAVSEPSGKIVHGRIGAIMPKEYTRMGPPVRHLTKEFSRIDCKTKLLMILSDGKPEDYDDYKGEYAIEDTRKALAEARGQGINTYCITIDQQAHDYLPRLFGQGNYTFVKEVKQLPARLSEIYRLLTT